MAAPYLQKPQRDSEREAQKLLVQSEKFSGFGTITSLVSTAFYFIEQGLGQRIPRWLNILSLTGVGMGIAAVAKGVWDKMKAADLLARRPAHRDMPSAPSNTASASVPENAADPKSTLWTEKGDTPRRPAREIDR